MTRLSLSLTTKSLRRALVVFLFLGSTFSLNVALSPSAAAAEAPPNEYYGSTGLWNSQSDEDNWGYTLMYLADSGGASPAYTPSMKLNCDENAKISDQPIVTIFAEAAWNATLDASNMESNIQTWYGMSSSAFLAKAEKIFFTLNQTVGKEDPCGTAADLIQGNPVNLKLKSCDGTIYQDSCGATQDEDRAFYTNAALKGCTGHWTAADNLAISATAAKNLYGKLLNSLPKKDFNKFVRDNMSDPANLSEGDCMKIHSAAKLHDKLIAQLKKELKDVCKGDDDALEAINDFSDEELAVAYSAKDDGCEAAIVAVEGESGSGEGESSCSIEGIGWIICPVMNFIAKLNDQAFGFLSDNFLFIDPKLLTSKDTEAAWGGFRDVANILFVIAFLLIVYSQISSQGISNYGIKRMLPRLIIAAVLVNASYFLCQLAVDISNIVGNNIASLLGEQMPTATSEGADSGFGGGFSWESTTAKILAGAAAVVVGLALLFALGLPGLLALVLIVLMLVARKALVILLVVVSPVAFVAYLLPNTESFFKKWWKLFSAMLVLYPIIGAVFGGSLLAAKIIAGTDSEDVLVQLTALGVLAIPLFSVPLLLKGAFAATGAIGAKLNNWQDRANKRALGNIKEGRSGEFLAARKAAKQRRQINRRTGHGVISGRARKYAERNPDSKFAKAVGVIGSPQTAFDSSRLGKWAGGDRGAAAATAAYHKEWAEEVDRQSSTMSDTGIDDLFKIMKDKKASKERRAAAARQIMRKGGDQHVQSALDYLGTETSDGAIGDIQQTVAEDVSKRKPFALGETAVSDLSRGSYGAGGGGDTSKAYGINQSLADRIQAGKLSSEALSRMGSDETERLAEIISDPAAHGLTQAHVDSVRAAIQGVRDSEQLAPTISGQKADLYLAIDHGVHPQGTGTSRLHDHHTVQP